MSRFTTASVDKAANVTNEVKGVFDRFSLGLQNLAQGLMKVADNQKQIIDNQANLIDMKMSETEPHIMPNGHNDDSKVD